MKQQRRGATVGLATQALPRSGAAITERQFQAQVEKLLKLHGWRYYHTHDSRRSVPGFPDLIAVRGRRMLALELKMPKAKASSEQVAWLQALDRIPGVEAMIVRQSEDIGELIALLVEGDYPGLPFAW